MRPELISIKPFRYVCDKHSGSINRACDWRRHHSIRMSAGQVLSRMTDSRGRRTGNIAAPGSTPPNDGGDDDISDDVDVYDDALDDAEDADAGDAGPGDVAAIGGQQSSNMEDSLRLDWVQRSSREQLLPYDWVRCTCRIGSYSCSCVW